MMIDETLPTYATCPVCSKPYNGFRIKAIYHFPPKDYAKAGIMFYHMGVKKQHPVITKVRYNFPEEKMIEQGMKKVAKGDFKLVNINCKMKM